jgi:hypothetical protein
MNNLTCHIEILVQREPLAILDACNLSRTMLFPFDRDRRPTSRNRLEKLLLNHFLIISKKILA